jgi:TorA maturation chaperone TorD
MRDSTRDLDSDASDGPAAAADGSPAGAGEPGTPDEERVARARSRVYDLLAAAFDGDVERLAAAMEERAFERLADRLPVTLDTTPLSADDADETALKVGYDNLFDVPGPHYVPPFASGHVDDPSESFESDSSYHEAGAAGELLGDPAAQVSQLYGEFGFRPSRGGGLPDHLAAELEFMASLADQEARLRADPEPDTPVSAADLREAQRAMVDQLGWLDHLDEAVAERDGVEGTFAALTRFARSYVAWDARAGLA